MFCSSCGSQISDKSKFCPGCGKALGTSSNTAPEQPVISSNASQQGMNFDFSTNTASPIREKRFEYKVVSQKDKWLSGKFDPAILEQALNAYAQQGWRVVGCATADIPGFGTARQEFLTIMEREV